MATASPCVVLNVWRQPRFIKRSVAALCMLHCVRRGLDKILSRAVAIGPAVRADFRRLYPVNAKTPTCCSSDDNRTKVTNSVTSARSLWWHVGPYFWPADLTRTANPIRPRRSECICMHCYEPCTYRRRVEFAKNI